MNHLNKSEIQQLIIDQLAEDLSVLEQAVTLARDTATHADCLGSSKYETMGLEASYLAQGQGLRLLEVERSLAYFKNLEAIALASQVGLSSLVQLTDEDELQQLLWLAAEAGGLKVQFGTSTITVITPRSPLGRALMGKCCDEDFEVHIAGKKRDYTVVEIY